MNNLTYNSKTKSNTITVASVLITLLIISAIVPLVNAYPPVSTTATEGPITVDGDITDWNIDLSDPAASPDFFAYLYNGWNNNGHDTILGYSFLRYDATNDIVYVLVIVKDEYPVINNDAECWVAIGAEGNKMFTGTSPNFAYVLLSEEKRGYEASFPLSAGSYQIAIHIDVYYETPSGDTAGTDGTFVPLELPPDMQVPEYALGGLIAVGACFAALFVFKKRQTIFKTKI